ncbi:MAG: IS3 family transposase [Chloroflexi bacterium]|nr:IS3 family transposase [Chloroflexota bacterium]
MKLSEHYPRQLVCAVVGLSSSSYYYQPHPRDATSLRAHIEQIAGEWPTYGYRRVSAQLAREHESVNHKRVRRVMLAMGLVPKNKAKKRHTTNSDHPFPRHPNRLQALPIERLDQAWVADITYVKLWREFVYLAVLMDVFTRCMRGWHLARSLDQELTLTALRRALCTHQPQIHHSDQGLQYAASDYTDLLQAHQVAISMAEVGEPTQNGYAERLMRTIREEEVNLSDYLDYADAYRQIGRFLDDVYMHKRIHSSLGYLTPVEFESQSCATCAKHT